jgi:hypothetical protein
LRGLDPARRDQRSRMRDYEPNELPSPQLVRVKAGESEEAVARLLGFQLDLPLPCSAVTGVFFYVDEHPRTVACGPSAARLVVLFEPLPRILADADVEPWGALAPQNIHKESPPRNPGH